MSARARLELGCPFAAPQGMVQEREDVLDGERRLIFELDLMATR
jgi:hypothetical protein